MSHLKRRQNLIERMEGLESQGLNCQGCEGTCCTFEANSMMITPLETFDLLSYLKRSGLYNNDLKNKLAEVIVQFRLDQFSGNGKKSFLRRTYTCPFFNHTELGCPLPREVKPYGCLAFNSHDTKLKAGAHCYSEINVLKQREETDPNEILINQKLRDKFQILWEKSSIPTALSDLWEFEFIDADLELN